MPHRPYSCGTTGGKPPKKQQQLPPKDENDVDIEKDTDVDVSTDDVPTDVDEPPAPIPRRSLRRQGALDGPAFEAWISATATSTTATSTTATSTTATSTTATAPVVASTATVTGNSTPVAAASTTANSIPVVAASTTVNSNPVVANPVFPNFNIATPANPISGCQARRMLRHERVISDAVREYRNRIRYEYNLTPEQFSDLVFDPRVRAHVETMYRADPNAFASTSTPPRPARNVLVRTNSQNYDTFMEQAVLEGWDRLRAFHTRRVAERAAAQSRVRRRRD
ncbi:hypothetical protein VNI00_013007 [Paramarasmius palmivorus]|uniref:Uncharacterized protein n=1 Tax=Paramarasmius palmivorus TaxID=297713 RepID=A0AAW0C2M6_9AGAR